MPRPVVSRSISTDATLHPFDEDQQHPFDEHSQAFTSLISQSVFPPTDDWQTLACIRAIAAVSVSQVNIMQLDREANEDTKNEDEDDVFEGLVASPDHTFSPPISPPSQQQHQDFGRRTHPWNLARLLDAATEPPMETFTPRTPPHVGATEPPSPPRPLRMPFLSTVESIGPPGSQVYKVTLPPHLVSLLDPLIAVAEAHAQRQGGGGWSSNLYSLTNQDLPLVEIPGAVTYTRPVVNYLTSQMQILYQCRCIWMDRNQPHLLKYSARSGYTGVGLHTDACDVTANLMMSRPTDYYGGGTWLEDPCNMAVHLNQGECLLHPGSLRHAGQSIHSGTRYCMVLFGFFQLPTVPSVSTGGEATTGHVSS